MSLKYKVENGGELFMRRRLLEAETGRAKQAAITCTVPEQTHFLFGRLSALVEYAEVSHKKIMDELIIMKQKREEISGIASLHEEAEFCLGCIAGMQAILEMDRTIFRAKGPMYIFLYTTTEELAEKYSLAMAAVENVQPLGGKGRVQYMVSCDVNALLAEICPLDDTAEYALGIVYHKGGAPEMEVVNRLSDGTGSRLYLLPDNSESFNCEKIVRHVLRATGL